MYIKLGNHFSLLSLSRWDCSFLLNVVLELCLNPGFLPCRFIFNPILVVFIVGFATKLTINVFLKVFLVRLAFLQISVKVTRRVPELAHFRSYTNRNCVNKQTLSAKNYTYFPNLVLILCKLLLFSCDNLVLLDSIQLESLYRAQP